MESIKNGEGPAMAVYWTTEFDCFNQKMTSSFLTWITRWNMPSNSPIFYTQPLISILCIRKISTNLLGQKVLIKLWWNWPIFNLRRRQRRNSHFHLLFRVCVVCFVFYFLLHSYLSISRSFLSFKRGNLFVVKHCHLQKKIIYVLIF